MAGVAQKSLCVIIKSVLIKPEGSLELVTPVAKVILLGAAGGYCPSTTWTVVQKMHLELWTKQKPRNGLRGFCFNSTDIDITSFTRFSKSITSRFKSYQVANKHFPHRVPISRTQACAA